MLESTMGFTETSRGRFSFGNVQRLGCYATLLQVSPLGQGVIPLAVGEAILSLHPIISHVKQFRH